jgi:hypothetical protein
VENVKEERALKKGKSRERDCHVKAKYGRSGRKTSKVEPFGHNLVIVGKLWE